MKVAIPLGTLLDYQITNTSGTPLYPVYNRNTQYGTGSRINSPATDRDYEAIRVVGGVCCGTAEPPHERYWRDIGPTSYQDSKNYFTNAVISSATPWTGAGAKEGDLVFDAAEERDFIAATDISAAQDTLRPGLAVRDSDEVIASYWIDAGSANAFAMLDQESASETRAKSPLTYTVRTTGKSNSISFWGLSGVESITVVVKDSGGATVETLGPLSLVFPNHPTRSATTFWVNHKEVTDPTYALTFTGKAVDADLRIASVIPGYANDLGCTRADVNESLVIPSPTRDEYGKLISRTRWYAREINATISVPKRDGDYAMELLGESQRAYAAVFDFSTEYLDEPGLKIWGILTSAVRVNTGRFDLDTINMTIGGFTQ